MSIYNKEIVTQLTRDGLKNLIKNKAKKGIFQIFDLEKLANKDPKNAVSSDKYRYLLLRTSRHAIIHLC